MAPGEWYRRGRDSLGIYREIAETTGLEIVQTGTQYIAGCEPEAAVLEEFAELSEEHGYHSELLDRAASVRLNPRLRPDNCLASLHFPDEMRIEPRTLFRTLIPWMERELGLDYRPGTVATAVDVTADMCRIRTSDGTELRAAHVFVCTGSDLRTLLPSVYRDSGLTHTRLQMVRIDAPPGFRLPTSLASGLSIRRYPSFRLCPSWPRLADQPVDPEYERRGIHVLIVQDPDGSLVIGDSHQTCVDERDDNMDARTESLILDVARTIIEIPGCPVVSRWVGFYTEHPELDLYTVTLGDRIHVITGIGGKGMTTGPALARESIDRIP